jgi:predicted CXXCH cytochrome family protein
VTEQVRIETRTMKIALVIGLMAIALLGLGLPSAFALDGPTSPQVADPVQAGTYPEIQVISLNGATAGDFTMFVDASCSYTGAIAYNAAATDVDSAIEATLGSCVGGSATVAGSAGGPWTITISGSSPVDLAPFVLNTAGLTGGSPTVNTVQDGTVVATSDIAPHSGYSSLTDYCLQCHQVHTNDGAHGTADFIGEYALLADLNVTSTCATCHGYLGNAPTGAEDPGFAGQEGTASLRAVYTSTPVHTIGSTSSRTQSGWSYGSFPKGPGTLKAAAGTASTYNGGFYCASCHTPHGEFGQLINSKWTVTSANATEAEVRLWQDGTAIWWTDPINGGSEKVMYLHKAATGWQVCTDAAGTTGCVPAQTKDAEGQIVSLYGYKLLSYSPNHQYPYKNGSAFSTGPGADNIWGNADDPTSTLPLSGEFADAGFTAGELLAASGTPAFSTESVLASLTSDISAAVTSVDVTSTSTTLGGLAVPFQIRIDDEIMTVVAKSPASGGSGTTFTLTVIRGENAEEPWSAVSAAAAHTAGAEVLRVPALYVNEAGFNGITPPGGTPKALPLHITFADGGTEMAAIQARIPVPTLGATYFVYTIARAVDGSVQTETHAIGTDLVVQAGSLTATVKSWGTDSHNHDMATWCGTCHTAAVDVSFGGAYHSHPTGCTACHGNPADGSSADFPHSSTSPFLLKAVPDALCITCHKAGTLP